MNERRLRLAIAVFALLGIAIAGYLTYVHYEDAQPFCISGGGGCEKVQTSDQSELLGVPVAVIGLGGYIAILLTAIIPGELGRLLGALLAIGGFVFSLYLTYHELFTIEAICQWCVASAVTMTVLAVLTSLRLLKSG